MDLWDLKKWRKKLALNQSEAAEKLGVGRGALQNWERELRPVPKTVELACEELARLAHQAPDFGPVLLVGTNEALIQQSDRPYDIHLSHLGVYENNEAAIEVVRATASSTADLLIMSADGTIIWDAPELREELKRLRDPSVDSQETNNNKEPI
jgi:DNA-binding XRE family transcriptional regulator